MERKLPIGNVELFGQWEITILNETWEKQRMSKDV
jgi:hypothetical protein